MLSFLRVAAWSSLSRADKLGYITKILFPVRPLKTLAK